MQHIFTSDDFRFLIEYPFKSNIPITIIFTHVRPIPSAKRITHVCPDSDKIDPFQDFWFLTTHLHYEWLPISNRIPFQIKHTHYSYLHSCLTHTQCKALNACLPGFWENRPESRFFVFDDTFPLLNNFRFLIEYPFKSNIPITVIYTHVWPIPSAKRLTHACQDSEKIDPKSRFFKHPFKSNK